MISLARFSKMQVALALLLGAFALTGCITVEDDDRHLKPLPARLISDMSAKGMSPSAPILVRIFKKESEL